jgi:hypothetical protein
VNGADAYITLPLKKDSDYLDVVERQLSDDWPLERKKLLNRITESYRKAPQFAAVYPLIEQIVMHEEKNLFRYILNSLQLLNSYLEIGTPLVISSSVEIDHSLKAEKKVIALCQALKADTYINPIGGVELYDKAGFKAEGIELQFLKANAVPYPQLKNEFVPFLSIIDVMMFNDRESLKRMIREEFTLN